MLLLSPPKVKPRAIAMSLALIAVQGMPAGLDEVTIY
jgi:hypothetical protein